MRGLAFSPDCFAQAVVNAYNVTEAVKKSKAYMGNIPDMMLSELLRPFMDFIFRNERRHLQSLFFPFLYICYL